MQSDLFEEINMRQHYHKMTPFSYNYNSRQDPLVVAVKVVQVIVLIGQDKERADYNEQVEVIAI